MKIGDLVQINPKVRWRHPEIGPIGIVTDLKFHGIETHILFDHAKIRRIVASHLTVISLP